MYLLVAWMSRGTLEGGVAETCPCLQRLEEEGRGEGRGDGERCEEGAAQSTPLSLGNSEMGKSAQNLKTQKNAVKPVI